VFTIQVLGPPRVTRDGAALTLSRRKSRAVVYYLAGHTRPVAREQVLSVLWPDLDRAAAQQTLRTTLHGLRKSLGPALLADTDRLALAPEVEVDARLFEAALAAGAPSPESLRAALDLYQGDFLDNFNLPDAPAFDDWVDAQREHYRRLAVGGLTALAAAQEEAADYASALNTLDRAIAFDPLQEDLQRTALRLHYLAGDRTGAIRRYDRLRRLLDEELGVPPMAETRALYDSLLADSPPAFTPPHKATLPGLTPSPRAGAPQPAPVARVQPIPFAGRAQELAQLRAVASSDTSLAARPFVLIEGEPGIGKTRLAEEYLRTSDTLVLAAGARELEQTLPYQPIIEALRQLLSHLAWPMLQAALNDPSTGLGGVWRAEVARLLPELQTEAAPPAGTPDEPRLWEGLHRFVAVLARQHPVSIFIDDLQWADASTLALLNYLHRRARAESVGVLFLATARPQPVSPTLAAWLQTLVRESRLLRLALSRLEPDDVAALARQWTAARVGDSLQASASLAEWLITTSEGNPYVLVELLRHACDQSLIGGDGTLDLQALAASPLVPRSVYSLIQSRLAGLSDAARRMLDAAVAAGRVFPFEVVYRAAGLSETLGLDALDGLNSAHLVQAASPGAGPVGGPPLTYYTFDHSLTMEVAYREAGEPRHRRMHRRLAEALEQVYGRQGVEPIAGVLAFHFFEGREPGRAAPYAAQAGARAARLAAWAEAIVFFEQALQAAASLAQRLPLAQQLGDAHLAAGHIDQAAEAFSLARTLARDLGDAGSEERATLALAQTQLSQARYPDVRRLAEQVLAAAPAPLSAAQAEFLIGTAHSLEGADLTQATEHLRAAERHLQAAAAQGQVDDARRAQVRFELGGVAAQRGHLAEAIALYREAMQIADNASAAQAQPFRVLARNNLAYHLHLLSPGDPEAQGAAEDGLRLAQSLGVLGLWPYLYSTLGEIALGRGDVDAAEERFQQGLALAEQQPLPERVAGLTANLGLVALARGETALALHRLSAAMAHADALGTHHLAAQIRLWLAPLLPPAEARARLAEVRAFAQGRTRLLADAEAVGRTLA